LELRERHGQRLIDWLREAVRQQLLTLLCGLA
jgi:hypothetical protein